MSGTDDLGALVLAALRRRDLETTWVGDFQRLTGGAMQETWRFEARMADVRHSLVLRRAPNAGTTPRPGTISLPHQADITRVAALQGVPGPEVVAVLDNEDALGPGFVMALVEGETVPQKILRDARFAKVRNEMAAICGEILARIHATPLSALPDLPRATAKDKLAALRRQYLEQQRPRPVFELAFQWLARRLPAEPPGRLVHGDFRNGNLIIQPDGVAAVLDWERAFIGDPMYDVGWLCVGSWRFGEIDSPVGGFGSISQFEAEYRAVGGEFDLKRARFWEVYGTLDWGVTTVELGREAADTGSLEAAAIGRRTTETEIDLLRLIRDERDAT